MMDNLTTVQEFNHFYKITGRFHKQEVHGSGLLINGLKL